MTSLRRRAASGWFAACLLLALSPVPTVLRADELAGTSPGITPGAADELWLISSRHLSSRLPCLSRPEPDLRVWQCAAGQGWETRDVPALVAAPPMIEVLYVHGNRMTHQEAVERALLMYRRIRGHCPAGAPIRWIIWSWPSERDGLMLKDVRTKAERTEAQAHYVAWTITQLAQRGTTLRMVGYSFGGRVITGALHVTAGGNLGCASYNLPPITGLNCRVGLVAPALDNDWLGPNRFHGKAGHNLSQLTIFINPSDPVLSGYWLLDLGESAQALGLRGPALRPRDAQGNLVPLKISNCSTTVGPSHDEMRYYLKPCDAACALSQIVWPHDDETPLLVTTANQAP